MAAAMPLTLRQLWTAPARESSPIARPISYCADIRCARLVGRPGDYCERHPACPICGWAIQTGHPNFPHVFKGAWHAAEEVAA